MRVLDRAKPRLFVAGVFAMVLALPGPVLAQITYTGYTNGCFGAGCIPANNSGFDFVELVNTNSTLRFVGSSFSGTATEGQVFRIGDAPNGRFIQELNNFGAFYLTMTGSGADTYSDVFTLAVRWVDPGTGLAVFTANLSGTIRIGQSAPNRVDIVFSTGSQSLNWHDPVTGQSGTVDFDLNAKTYVIAGSGVGQTSSVALIGEATITTVPEPATLILMGSGLLGLAGAARRRRRAQEDVSSI